MGLTIRSSHKQELSSVYQFIDVLYSLRIYEALRHWSLSCLLLLLQFRMLSSCSCSVWRSLALYLCRAIYTKLVVIWLATIGRCYYWSHTSARSVRLYTGECVVDSSTGLWDRASATLTREYMTNHTTKMTKSLIEIDGNLHCLSNLAWWKFLFTQNWRCLKCITFDEE